MQFTTQIPILKSNHPIDYDSRIVSLGSCFAVNISEKFDYFKFQNSVNPFGILFHPLAIQKLISYAVSDKRFTQDDIFHLNDCWHCFDTHSDLNAIEKDQMLLNLNSVLNDFRKQLLNATHLIITLGTAWVYKNSASGEIVANCHKVPQKQFDKRLLSMDEIRDSLGTIYKAVNTVNPTAKIILTVSPVRHVKDGFIENQWSKSNLISGIHQFLHEKHEQASYFASYEIMMDELRDYRFYTADLIHPNQIAIDYIWEKFSQTTITGNALATMKTVASIQKRLAHRPLNPDTQNHKDFLSHLQDDISKIQNQFPHIAF